MPDKGNGSRTSISWLKRALKGADCDEDWIWSDTLGPSIPIMTTILWQHSDFGNKEQQRLTVNTRTRRGIESGMLIRG